MYDFVVSISLTKVDGQNELRNFYLTSFKPTETQTAYKNMRDSIIQSCQGSYVQWVSVSLVINNQYICTMKGDLDWLKNVEYFTKFIGTSATDDFQQASFGFIDYKNNLRIEFENGIVMILPI